MKISTLFWGVLFFVLGALILLNNLSVICVEWSTIWRLWPILLILWGLSLVIGKERPKWYVILLVILLVIFMIIAAAVTSWHDRDYNFVEGEANHQTFVEPYSAGIERATFNLSSGAGRFFIQDTTTQLLDAATTVNVGKYTLITDRSGDSESFSLRYRGRSGRWNFGTYRNRAEIKLNANPVWDIGVDMGASSLDLNLVPYKVDNVKINAGASSMKLTLGDRSTETHVRIQAGVSSIEVEVPEGVGCEVRAETKLSSRRIRGFEKIGDYTYQTPNFDEAAKKIYIDIDAGVSTVRVERY